MAENFLTKNQQKKDLWDFKISQEKLENEKETLQKQLRELKEESQKEINNFQTKLTYLNIDLKTIVKSLNKNWQTIQESKKTISSFDKELKNTKTKYLKTNDNLNQERIQHQETFQQLLATETEKNNWEKKAQEKFQQGENWRKNYHSTLTSLSEEKDKNCFLRSNLTKKKREIANLNKELREIRGKINELKEEIITLKTLLCQARNDLLLVIDDKNLSEQVLKADLLSLNEQLEQTKTELTTSDTQLQETQQQRDSRPNITVEEWEETKELLAENVENLRIANELKNTTEQELTTTKNQWEQEINRADSYKNQLVQKEKEIIQEFINQLKLTNLTDNSTKEEVINVISQLINKPPISDKNNYEKVRLETALDQANKTIIKLEKELQEKIPPIPYGENLSEIVNVDLQTIFHNLGIQINQITKQQMEESKTYQQFSVIRNQEIQQHFIQNTNDLQVISSEKTKLVNQQKTERTILISLLVTSLLTIAGLIMRLKVSKKDKLR